MNKILFTIVLCLFSTNLFAKESWIDRNFGKAWIPTASKTDNPNRGRLWRTFVADWPQHLERGLNYEKNCLDHAELAQKRLGGEIITGYVPRTGKHHAVLVIKDWVIDNGHLGNRIFPAKDLCKMMESDYCS